MFTRKRIVVTVAGALALSTAAAGGAWAKVLPVDRYENDDAFGHKPAYRVDLQDRRLVIFFNGPTSPFNNDHHGPERLLGVTGTPKTAGIRWAVKYGKGPNHEPRLVIHFARNFTTLTGGFTRPRYDVLTGRHENHHAFSYLLFDMGGLCGKASCH